MVRRLPVPYLFPHPAVRCRVPQSRRQYPSLNRAGLAAMFGLGQLSRAQRLTVGVVVLLLVDIIWVASSEMTKYLFEQEQYGKPYFSTYLKTSMFFLYLTGFVWWRSWWLQCRKNALMNGEKNEEKKRDGNQLISDPVYVPLKFDEKSSSTDSDDSIDGAISRAVRFSALSEVRQLSDADAEEAVMARLSYPAYVRAEEARLKAASKLTVKQVAKVAVIFCFIFFFGNLAYQEALNDSEEGLGMIHVLSSSSGLFTLVLAAVFPSSNGDRITLSKLVAVALSIAGVVLVSLSGSVLKPEIPLGALWALCGALLYAIYLVLLRRRVDNEDKLNIPMFFGFVGFFTLLFLWPGLLILHFTGAEQFEWPDRLQWIFLVVNGVLGTVVSELLWLWGCFLTSSLVATLALSLTVPMTVMADLCFRKDASYNWMFYAGSGPVFLAFFGVSILSHYENWDPVLLAVKKCLQCLCRRRLILRIRDIDREQTETLISINSNHGDS